MFFQLSLLLLAQNTTEIPQTAYGIATEKPVAIYASTPKDQWSAPQNATDDNFLTAYATQACDTAGKRSTHFLTAQYAQAKKVYGFVYIQDPYRNPGRIKDYAFYVTPDSNFTQHKPVISGTFPKYNASFWPEKSEKFYTIWFPKPIEGNCVTLVAQNDHMNSNETYIGELVPIFNPDTYRYKETSMALLKGRRMAPSVHLSYDLPAHQDLYYLEMTPKQSSTGTYMMALGFDGGYFGIQEQSNGKKVVIFSIWDSAATDNPNDVDHDARVRAIYADSELTVRRFGGEGVGVQTFLDCDWKIDETYKFVMTFDQCLNDNFGVFTAYFFDPSTNQWRRLASLALPGRKAKLNSAHSFMEDFRRNFNSFYNNRQANYTNIWSYDRAKNKWTQAKRGNFTVDSNPQRNIDAGPVKNGGFLSTGGHIENKTIPIHSPFNLGVDTARTSHPELPSNITRAHKFKVNLYKETP